MENLGYGTCSVWVSKGSIENNTNKEENIGKFRPINYGTEKQWIPHVKAEAENIRTTSSPGGIQGFGINYV